MVPFVLPTDDRRLLIHVSALATHTAGMRAHPRVGLLVMADLEADVPAQALLRVALQADALDLQRDGSVYAAARAAWLRG